jgi:hypothetical protein
MAPVLIALHSPQPGSGKTTLRKMLAERLEKEGMNVEAVSFAAPIKACVQSLLMFTEMPLADVNEAVYGGRKEAMIPFLGVSSRRLQQTLGTEWGRTYIDDTVWIRIALQRIYSCLKKGTSVILDDLRFPNEMEALQGAGAFTVYLLRQDARHWDWKHDSEQGIDGHQFDYGLENKGTLDDLRTEADTLVPLILSQRQAA